MQRYIFCYDIADVRRRDKIANCLSAYGDRVQLSVFEVCATPRQYARILAKLQRILDMQHDNLLVYVLCPTCTGKVVRLGNAEKNAPHIPACLIF